MKGFELSTNMIIVIALAVVSLAALLMYFNAEGGRQQRIAQAQQVFGIACQEYKDNSCAWSSTRSGSFPRFLSACQTLFGQENRAFSCLYQYCCNQPVAATCDGLCALCKGNDYAGIGADDVTSCLAIYYEQCTQPCAA